MSVVPIGCANDTTPMYEDNSAIVSVGNLVTALGSFDLPPNGSVEYTVVPARPYGGNPASLVSYLMTINFEIQVSGAPGASDISDIGISLGGYPADTIDFDRAVFAVFVPLVGAQVLIPSVSGAYTLSGVVQIEKNQSVQLSIQRNGGNAAVTYTLLQVFPRFKFLN